MALDMRYFYEKFTKGGIVGFVDSKILSKYSDRGPVSLDVTDKAIKLHTGTIFEGLDIVITPEKCIMTTLSRNGKRMEDFSQEWLNFRGDVNKTDYAKWVKKEQNIVVASADEKKKDLKETEEQEIAEIEFKADKAMSRLARLIRAYGNVDHEKVNALKEELIRVKEQSKKDIATVRARYGKELSDTTSATTKAIIQLEKSKQSLSQPKRKTTKAKIITKEDGMGPND